MIKIFADWFVYGLLNLDSSTRLGDSLNFFVYDTVKIYLLIIVIIAVIAFIRTLLPPHKLKEVFAKQKYGIGNISSALLGSVTPFCSCSSIPIL